MHILVVRSINKHILQLIVSRQVVNETPELFKQRLTAVFPTVPSDKIMNAVLLNRMTVTIDELRNYDKLDDMLEQMFEDVDNLSIN